ncbi:MAG: hypothetical protein IMF19_07650 [Proteobacteria bacterium]|nr:hypothetical protein [Pseudomonadota bacterium]
MSNNNQIPWRIIISIIVVILATIGATWAFWLNSLPSDFDISINPMKGEVQQGGVIITTITIKGIQGYEHPVNLSASGHPSDIVVTFILPIGGPTSSYTSTVTIKVNPNVPVGDYKIIMKGTGTDGKEHSCIYALTVKSPVKPTPSPIITPTPTPTPTSKSIETHLTPQNIQIRLSQWPEKVSKGKEVNFSWEIILSPELLPAYKEYCFEIVDSKGRIIEEYPKRFHIESEEIRENESWKVPLECVKTPTGRYGVTITFPCDDPRASATTYFEVVETMLVIQKFFDTNLNGKIDDADERLAGWVFKVTDPFRETSTHFTDVNGEIRIGIMEGKEGKYTIEEIVKSSWRSVLPIKQTVIVPKGKTTTVKLVNTIMSTAGLLIQKFNDTNLNGKIDDGVDEKLQGWKFNVTDPNGKTSTHFTDVNGEIRIEVPEEYEGKDYVIEDTLQPGWKPVLPIRQTVKVLKDEGITVKFLNKKPISITLTYYDFNLDEVCTYEDNYCGWVTVPGKAIIYGSMTTNITVPEGASELEVTISIGCNGYGEGLLGQPDSAAYIRVDSEVREERIDSTMSFHHGNYYKYEWCETFSNTFKVMEKEEITLIIEMSGDARLDFELAKLSFS